MYLEEENKVAEEAPVEASEPQVEETPKEESPKEEAPAKEQKKAKVNPDECLEFKRSENVEETVEQIEKERAELLKAFNKTKLISRIIMGSHDRLHVLPELLTNRVKPDLLRGVNRNVILRFEGLHIVN